VGLPANEYNAVAGFSLPLPLDGPSTLFLKKEIFLKLSRLVRFAAAAALSTVLAGTLPRDVSAQDAGGVRYTVSVSGEPSGRVTDLIEEASQLLALLKRPPPSLAALSRRIRDDEDRIRAILESEGYYDAVVATKVGENASPVAVDINIDAGKPYTLASLVLEIGPRSADKALPVLRDQLYQRPIEDVKGKPARAASIIAAEDAAIAALRAGGFAFAKRGDRQVHVDHQAGVIAVTLPVHLGPDAVFGNVRVEGSNAVADRFVDSLVTWTPGMRYDATRLERLRLDLITSGLFSSVKVQPAATEDIANGAPLDVDVDVQDALHHTFGIGGKYARDKGVGASAFWEHRNILGGGERLRLAIDATEIDQTVSAAFTRPAFLRPDQTLKLTTELGHHDTDAFREWGSTTTTALERRLSDTWTVSAGVSLDLADIEDIDGSRRSYLAGLPMTATWSTTDPLIPLDPVRGWRVALAGTPFAGTFSGSVAFFRSEAQASVYVPLDTAARSVFAARLKAGSIVGATTNQIPANRRFYAGGGGSIRGYGYQLVSPIGADLNPTGGRSLLEASLEVRYRINNTFGVVPFVDAGMTSLSNVPGLNGQLRSAVGIGGRYFTPVGPLRVDIAMPVNRRPGIDKRFQFYISFGQAF
jgi:translocation and assembly module TamA